MFKFNLFNIILCFGNRPKDTIDIQVNNVTADQVHIYNESQRLEKSKNPLWLLLVVLLLCIALCFMFDGHVCALCTTLFELIKTIKNLL